MKNSFGSCWLYHRLIAVARNPELAKFITQIKYVAFDFEKHRSQANVFKDELMRTDAGKQYISRKTPAAKAKLVDREYRQYMGYYSEHQQLLKNGADVVTLRSAFAKFRNLRGVGFKRLASDWLCFDHWILRYGSAKVLSKPVMKSKQSDLSLKPLHAPVYWNGFLNLAAEASTYHDIDTLR